MGCDIHLYVEKLDPETRRWGLVDPPKDLQWDWYSERNYSLFAVLADVRNGFGFAGGCAREPVTPLASPRGIPEDASDRYKTIVGPYTGRDCKGCNEPPYNCEIEHGWGEDGHSHSWFTLRELMTTELWDQEQIKGDVVSAAGYLEWLSNGRLSNWSGGISGPGIEIVEPAEMQRRLDAGVITGTEVWPNATTYTNVKWKHPLRDSLGDEWFNFLKSAAALTLDNGSDVRAVFFFDN